MMEDCICVIEADQINWLCYPGGFANILTRDYIVNVSATQISTEIGNQYKITLSVDNPFQMMHDYHVNDGDALQVHIKRDGFVALVLNNQNNQEV